MTDEEYAARMQSKAEDEQDLHNAVEEQDLSVIDIERLDALVECAKKSDYDGVQENLEFLTKLGYDGENQEFLEALSDVAQKKDADAIVELVNTYKDLKL